MIWIGFRETGSTSPTKGEEQVHHAFGSLANEYRLPLWLSLGLNMRHAEISEILGVPPARVRTRIATGAALLLQACGSVGVETDMRSIESLLARMAAESAPASLMHKLKDLTRCDKHDLPPPGQTPLRKKAHLPAGRARRTDPWLTLDRFPRQAPADGIPIGLRLAKGDRLGPIDRMRRT